VTESGYKAMSGPEFRLDQGDMPPEEKPSGKSISFAGDVLKLVSGTTIAQLITLLAAPILTRLYSPDAWGVLAIFHSITLILGIIACMRYELAIMLPETDEEAANLLGVSLGFSFIIGLLLIPVCRWCRDPLLTLMNAPALGPYLWLVPPMVCISGVFLALNYWNSRTRHFGRLSIARVSSSLATTTVTLGLGFAGYATAGSMVGASVAGQTVATSVLGGQIWRDNRSIFRRSIRWRDMIATLKRYRSFPIFSTWSGLLNTVSWQLPVLMFGAFFSPAVVGFYALGFRILQMPMMLIGRAIGQVFHQRAAEANIQGALAPLTEGIIRRLVVFCLLPMLMLTIIGRDVFVVVFGREWAEAGVYTQILSVWAIVWFVSSPLSTLYGVLEKQAQGLLLQAAIFLSRLVSIGIGAYLDNAKIALLLFSLSGIGVYGYLIYKIAVFSEVNLRNIAAGLTRCAALTMLFMLVIAMIKIVFGMPVIIVGSGIGCAAAYFYLLRHDLFGDSMRVLKAMR